MECYKCGVKLVEDNTSRDRIKKQYESGPGSVLKGEVKFSSRSKTVYVCESLLSPLLVFKLLTLLFSYII